MKILELALKAYGPFTDCRLDLSGGSHGLHLIHGPNEAGKSSTLRALSAWLFGIHQQTDDDFLHDYKALRVGGTLLGDDGRKLSAIRLKRREKTLETPDGTVVPDAEMMRLLGRLTQGAFEKQFRIDHAELRKGGAAMTQGNGEVSQALFSAGAGLAGLRKAVDTLDKQLDELFKPRGKKAINIVLSDLDAARTERKNTEVAPAAWTEEDSRKQKITTELARVDADLKALAAERAEKERIVRTLPIADQIVELRSRLAPLQAAKILSDGFAVRRARAQAARDSGKSRRDQAKAEIDRLQAEIAGIEVPAEVLAESAALDTLLAERSSYQKGVRDLRKATDTLEHQESAAHDMLAELRPGLDLDTADSLRISSEAKDTIRRLGRSFEALVKAREQAEARVNRWVATASGLDPTEAKKQAEGLESGLKRWRVQAAVDAQIAQDLVEIEATEKKAATVFKRLTRWSGTLSELETLAVPTAEAVEAATEESDRAETRRADLERDHDRATTELRQIDAQIKALQLAGEIASESDLAAARERRDAAWQLLRPILLHGTSLDRAEAAAGQDSGGASAAAVVDDFERSTSLADSLADRLRREAERVHAAARLESDRQEKADELSKLGAKRDQAEAAYQQAQSRWNGLWEPLGVQSGTAKEMRAWIKSREDVLTHHETAQSSRRHHEARVNQQAIVRDEALGWFTRLGEPLPLASDTLASLVDTLEAVLDRLKQSVELAAARKEAEDASEKLDAWRQRWSEAIAPIGRDGTALPDAVEDHIGRIEALFKALDAIKKARKETVRIKQETDEYELVVRGLGQKLLPDSAVTEVAALSTELLRQYETARHDDALRTERLKTLAEAEAKLAAEDAGISKAEEDLHAFRLEAGMTPDSDEFEDFEQASSEHKRLADALAVEERRLVELAEGKPIEKVIEAARAVDREELQQGLQDLEARLAPLDIERDRLNQELGASSQKLSLMDGRSSAAEHEQRVQSLIAHLSGDAERYAQLRIGKSILERAMQRYREKNEGTVLRRAGDIFAGLTLGSFISLSLEETEKGESYIAGVRPDGKPLETRRMSDGTADALYLALRIATLEVEFEAHGPVPFVVDDILINLDNRRTEAALDALAALSKRTQVLLFTHHEHLVELARERLVEPDLLFVHQLQKG